MAYTPGRQMTTRQYVWNGGIDHRQNRAGFSDLQSKGYFIEYELGFPNSNYTTATLSAMGK
jgi:hypothetical protein